MTKIIENYDQAKVAARELAAAWSRTAADRDADGANPTAELELLSQSGLLAVTVPRSYGGAGLSPGELAQLAQIWSEGDVALGQVPQNHFDWVDLLISAPETTRSFFYAELLAGKRFGNALAEFGPDGERTIQATLVPDGPDGYRLSATKYFATGALSADWLTIHAFLPDGPPAVAYIARDSPGVEVRDDWDSFGQRATRSGTVILTNVRVSFDHVVVRGSAGKTLQAAGLAAGNFLIHAAIEIGGAHAVLNRAVEQAANGNAVAAKFVTDWQPRVEAAELLVRRAGRIVDETLAHPTGRDAAINAHVSVNLAKSRAFELGVAIADAFFIAGLGSLAATDRLDRIWRNSRVHTLHDDTPQRIRDIGIYYLTGEYPRANSQLLELSEL